MSVQESIDRFAPDDDIIQVRGPFNSWSGTEMTLMEGSTSVYEAEVEIFDADGTELEYKFFISSAELGDLWEASVGTGDNGNRVFTYMEMEEGQVLETAFFDDLESDPGAGIEVTFQVDMAILIESELFLPEFDYVEARGAFNSWTAGFELTPIEEGSTIYAGTTEIKTVAPGSPVEYKYIYNGGSWEDGSNRSFVLAEESPQSLRLRYFNDLGPDSALTADTEILFTVDMNNTEIPFDPENDMVYINGLFAGNTWWEWGNPPFDFELLDDGNTESGDAVAGDGIYSIKFESFEGDPRKVEYKYAINGEDNEAGFQQNHIRYIRESETYAFPLDTFGTILREPEELPSDPGSISISGPVDGMITLRWENPNAILERSNNLTTESWGEVPDSFGEGDITLPTDTSAGYFRLRIPE